MLTNKHINLREENFIIASGPSSFFENGTYSLKGKFTSREGALASKFNYPACTLSEVMQMHLFFESFHTVYLSKMYAEVAKISMKRYFDF